MILIVYVITINLNIYSYSWIINKLHIIIKALKCLISYTYVNFIRFLIKKLRSIHKLIYFWTSFQTGHYFKKEKKWVLWLNIYNNYVFFLQKFNLYFYLQIEFTEKFKQCRSKNTKKIFAQQKWV
jgi:hypothetical protein